MKTFGLPGEVSFRCFLLPSAGGGRSPPALAFLLSPYNPRGGGKVGNLLLVFHFPIALVAGAVGMWESRPPFGEIPKGLVERVGSLLLAFHAFHSPDISTALSPYRVVRQRANMLSFACCIRRADSVSLRASARCFSTPAVIPSFKYSVHSFREVSFSYGVR